MILNLIENLDEDKLIADIDNNICVELNDLIENEKTVVQLEILNIVLIIAKRGSEMVEI